MSSALQILTDACARLPVTVRKMFGGHGFFAPNGGMFAGIVTDDAVILKLEKGPARDELIAAGGQPWTYQGMGKPVTMQDWIVIPDDFYDDHDTLSTWLARAHKLAPAKKPAKKSAKKASKPTPKQTKPSKKAKKKK